MATAANAIMDNSPTSVEDELGNEDTEDLLEHLGLSPTRGSVTNRSPLVAPVAAVPAILPATVSAEKVQPAAQTEVTRMEDVSASCAPMEIKTPKRDVAVASEYAGREQSYAEFCEMIGLPPAVGGPALMPLPKYDRMAAVNGAMIMEAHRRRAELAATGAQNASPHQEKAITGPPPAGGAGAGAGAAKDDRLDDIDELGIDALVLELGCTRDIVKSPKHHRLQMDNFLPEEATDDEAEGEAAVDEAATGDTAAVAVAESGSADRPHPPALSVNRAGAAAAALAAADDDDVSEEEGGWVQPGGIPTAGGQVNEEDAPSSPEWVEVSPQPKSPAQDSSQDDSPPPLLDSPPSHASPPSARMPLPPPSLPPPPPPEAEATAEAADSEEVTPFSLDPDFDYESIPHTERFSVARELTRARA